MEYKGHQIKDSVKARNTELLPTARVSFDGSVITIRERDLVLIHKTIAARLDDPNAENLHIVIELDSIGEGRPEACLQLVWMAPETPEQRDKRIYEEKEHIDEQARQAERERAAKQMANEHQISEAIKLLKTCGYSVEKTEDPLTGPEFKTQTKKSAWMEI